jgi:UDP-N-acetylglucosamine 2-epimerase (non-hydrolysing)
MLSLVAGARPNFMKIAPLVPALRHAGIEPRIIHTGQHYDRRMSDTFFEELEIPQPDVNLGVGSGSHVWQIAEVMRRLEEDLAAHPPQAVVVVGDVNSTVAAAIAAKKLGLPLAHIEAGQRSFDRAMPEEINRQVTDVLADWLYTSELSGNANLAREGIPAERVEYVGNVAIDTLLACLDRAREGRHPERLGLAPGEYAVLTLHRPSNVDCPERLASIFRAVHEISRRLPVVFPVHPRTKARLNAFGFAECAEQDGYVPIEPLGYLAMLGLVEGARLVMTDSGGLQAETTALQVPCLTLRDNTEWPATVDGGSNRLVGWKTESIVRAATEVLAGPVRFGAIPPKWDGHAAERIAHHLADALARPGPQTDDRLACAP